MAAELDLGQTVNRLLVNQRTRLRPGGAREVTAFELLGASAPFAPLCFGSATALQTHHGGQLGAEGAGVGLNGAVESGGSDGERVRSS